MSQRLPRHAQTGLCRTGIRSTHGAALTEYGLTLGLIGVLAIGSVLAAGEQVERAFCIATNSLIAAQESERPLNETCLLLRHVSLGPGRWRG